MGIMENGMETSIVFRAYMCIMEKKMETTIVYLGSTGITENTIETTISVSSDVSRVVRMDVCLVHSCLLPYEAKADLFVCPTYLPLVTQE